MTNIELTFLFLEVPDWMRGSRVVACNPKITQAWRTLGKLFSELIDKFQGFCFIGEDGDFLKGCPVLLAANHGPFKSCQSKCA